MDNTNNGASAPLETEFQKQQSQKLDKLLADSDFIVSVLYGYTILVKHNNAEAGDVKQLLENNLKNLLADIKLVESERLMLNMGGGAK